MGKQPFNFLLTVTIYCSVFLAGFFFGRNYNHASIQVSHLSARQDAAQPTQTQESDDPLAQESTGPASTAPGQSEPATLININTATAAQLESLPGIGEVIAQRIIDYREANGSFPSVYALTNVKGIGEKRLAELIHLITV